MIKLQWPYETSKEATPSQTKPLLSSAAADGTPTYAWVESQVAAARARRVRQEKEWDTEAKGARHGTAPHRSPQPREPAPSPTAQRAPRLPLEIPNRPIKNECVLPFHRTDAATWEKTPHFISELQSPIVPRIAIAMAATGWSDLPSELLTDIAGGITELADIARFRSVCSSWRSAARDAAAAPPPQPPWLLLPSSPSWLFFCPREDRIYPNLRLPRPAAEAHHRRRRRLYASPHGWALAIDPTDLAASLVHPFTGATRQLPRLPSFFAETDDMAWDWSPHGVMASCGEGLLFCGADPTAAASSWAPIPALADCNASSINYAGGEFFVFEEDVCRTTVVDAVTLAVAAVIPAPAVELPAEARVAVAGDELFLLVKSKWMYLFGDDVDFSKAFHVNHRGVNPPAWQELAGIGDRALFVDSLHGFAVPTAGFGNLENNTIYSVSSKEVNNRRPTTVNYNVSAFSLESRSSKKLACRLNDREMAMRAETPSWILPSLDEG
jgi:hypothetical protein